MTLPEWLAALICMACAVPVIASYLAAQDDRERARRRMQREPWTLVRQNGSSVTQKD